MVTLLSAYADVRPQTHDPPLVAAAGVGLAQAHHVTEAKLQGHCQDPADARSRSRAISSLSRRAAAAAARAKSFSREA